MDNTQLVRRFLEEVWNKGNFDTIDDLVSEKYTASQPIVGEVRGLSSLKEQVRTFRTAFPDLRLTIDDIGASGDRVFVRWTGRGTHRGMFMGVAPTNNRGEIHGISLDRIANGKIVEHYESYDSLSLFQVIGAVAPLELLVKGHASTQQGQRPRA